MNEFAQWWNRFYCVALPVYLINNFPGSVLAIAELYLK